MNQWTKIRFYILILLVLSAFMPSAVQADDETESEQVDNPTQLTLGDCFDIAIGNNIGLRRARLGIESSLLDRIRSDSVFDPGFELDFSTRHFDVTSTGSFSTLDNQYDLGMRYIQPTWNGSSWVVSLDQGLSSGSYTTGTDTIGYTSYSTQFGLAYSHPLLEGYGERVNRIGVQRSDLGIMRSETAVFEAERNLRLAIVQIYIQAVLAVKRIEVAEVSLETTENLVEEVQALIDVGLLAPYEILAAQAGLAERQEAILNSEATLAVSLDSLKEIIGIPITDEIGIDPGTLLTIRMDLTSDEFYQMALEHRPDLLDIDLRIQQAHLDLLLAQDRTQSTLNWTTILGLAGEGDEYTESVSDLEHFTWYTGLEYKIPLGGNRAAEVDVALTLLALEQLELERIDTIRILERDIRSALEDFNTALLRIDVTIQGLEVQEVKMESEMARFGLGLITSRDLLEFDLELANAFLAYDSALADAILALARLEYIVNFPLLEDALLIGNIQNETEVVE